VARNPTSQTMPVTIRVMDVPLLAIAWRVFCIMVWMAASSSSALSGEMFIGSLFLFMVHHL
jgi:hypothetical protein